MATAGAAHSVEGAAAAGVKRLRGAAHEI